MRLPKINCFIVIITFFLSCEKSATVHTITGKEININDSLAETKAITDFITPYKAHLDKALDSTLGYAPETLTKNYERNLNTSLGNFMADAVFEQANPVFKKRTGKDTDFVLLNHGGLRAPISKGPVTERTSYEVMPFENKLVVAELSPEKMQALLTYLAAGKRAHPISSHLHITLNNNYELRNVTLREKPLEKSRNYYVMTSDYLLNGGDHMDFFADPVSVTDTDYLLRNALTDYFKKTDTITAVTDNRFIITDN